LPKVYSHNGRYCPRPDSCANIANSQAGAINTKHHNQMKFELFNRALITRETNTDGEDTAQRIKYILGQKASTLLQ